MRRHLQYLHEAAAFSFSADEKPCGDTGDLKRRATQEGERKKKRQNKEGERLQEILNEALAE